MDYWIQNSDFSNPTGIGESEPVESVRQLMNILTEYDWAKENAYEEKCLANNDSCCPAGIGIVAEDGHLLHICPKVKKGTVDVHFQHSVSIKILGFIKWNKSQWTTYEKIPFAKLESAVKSFLANDYAAISTTFKKYEA